MSGAAAWRAGLPQPDLLRGRYRYRRGRLRRGCSHSDLRHGRKGQLIELIAPVLHVLQQPLAHAARPELVDVVGYTVQRHLPVGFGAEEIANVVRHLDDVLGACVAHLTDAVSAAFNRLS
jgi:hypothetical protein